MKIDLFKLNNLGRLEIDQDLVIDESLFGTSGIRAINNLHVSGVLRCEMDEVMADLKISGEFILGCAVTLEDVTYPFDINLDESLGNFDDIYNQNKQTFDILPFIWGDIVANVPIRVVKEGCENLQLSGDGWELVSE